MSAEGIAAILVALSTFIGGTVLAVRGLTGDRVARKTSEAAALLTGYTDMVAVLRGELTSLRTAHAEDTDRIQKQHREEMDRHRTQHEAEMLRLEKLHQQELESLIHVYTEERKSFELRIAVLEAETERPPTIRQRSTDT